MPFHVDSEVGKLRKVLVHSPGLEHRRLTPTNAGELLFDDVMWVKRAIAEHKEFCSLLRDRGIEVFDTEDLLAETLDISEARRWVLSRVLNERNVGANLARRRSEWAVQASSREVADYLIGGVVKADLTEGEGLTYTSSHQADMLLPPLPNFIFQRDPSCWIYDGYTLNPMSKAARRPETAFMQAIYRWHPMFADQDIPIWHGGVDEDWGRATIEGGDVMPIGNGAVMIGMGERTAPQAVTMVARELFKAGSATLVLAVMLPKSRHYMHLDTVMTLVDRDAVTIFPEIVEGARVWAIRPGPDPDVPLVEPFGGGVIDALEHALGVSEMRVVATGGDPFESQREQWNDGNNVLALEPGVVVAYDRNDDTNARLRQAGIEVLEVPGSEIGRGRGGAHCLTCPIERDAAY